MLRSSRAGNADIILRGGSLGGLERALGNVVLLGERLRAFEFEGRRLERGLRGGKFSVALRLGELHGGLGEFESSTGECEFALAALAGEFKFTA